MNLRLSYSFAGISALIATACSTTESAGFPAAISAPPAASAVATEVPALQFSVPDGGGLSVEDALAHARENSPALRAAAFRLYAQQELLQVAGNLPDPEFSARVEAVPLSSPRSGKETLIGFSQPIPLAGQLNKNEDLEQARLESLRVVRDRIGRELEARLRGAFATALSLQNALELHASRVLIAEFSEDLQHRRVVAGDAIPSILAQTRAHRVSLEAELQAVARQHQLARSELFAVMGIAENQDSTAQPITLEATLGSALELPNLQFLADQIENIPAVAAALSTAKVAKLKARLAAANKIPMINLELFYRGRDGGQDGFDAGLMFALPLSGRSAATSRASQAESAAAMQMSAISERDALIELKRLHASLALAMNKVQRYQTELIPAANEQLAIGEARFIAGDMSLAEVLPLRNQTIKIQLEQVQAWHQLMSAWAELSPYLP